MATPILSSLDIPTQHNTIQKTVGEISLYPSGIESAFTQSGLLPSEVKQAQKEKKSQKRPTTRAEREANKSGRKLCGWNWKMRQNLHNTGMMLELSAITERKGADIVFGVASYPPGVFPMPDIMLANRQEFFRYLRDDLIPAGEFAAIWSTENKGKDNLFAGHGNYLMALTPREQRLAQQKWWKIAGWHDPQASLHDALFISLPNREDRRDKSTEKRRSLCEQVIRYMASIGRKLAARKAYQYQTPEAWLLNETGTGRMWGYVGNLKKQDKVTFTITNLRQRKAVDAYIRRVGGAQPKVVQWLNDDGEISRPFDLGMWSRDRIYGSRQCLTVTPQMVADIRYIIEALA